MNEELSNTQLAELIVVHRASRRRPNTVSLKWETKPSQSTTKHFSELITQGYLTEWIIDHPRYSWQIGVSLKGENAIASTTLPKVILDLVDVSNLRLISSLMSYATQEELPMLLTHSILIVRRCARDRIEHLNQW